MGKLANNGLYVCISGGDDSTNNGSRSQMRLRMMIARLKPGPTCGSGRDIYSNIDPDLRSPAGTWGSVLRGRPCSMSRQLPGSACIHGVPIWPLQLAGQSLSARDGTTWAPPTTNPASPPMSSVEKQLPGSRAATRVVKAGARIVLGAGGALCCVAASRDGVASVR